MRDYNGLTFSGSFLAIPKAFFQITPSVESALFLAWLLEKGRIKQEGNPAELAENDDWFRCSAEQIRTEFQIGKSVQERACKELKELGFVECERRGVPARRWVRVNTAAIINALNSQSDENRPTSRSKTNLLVGQSDENRPTSRSKTNRHSTPLKNSSKNPANESRENGSSRTSSKEIDAVVEHYRSHRSKARPGKKEREKISHRLKEGWTVDELKTAIDGNFRSPWHCGENDQDKPFHNLELIMRDSDHVTQFIELAEQYKPSGGSNGQEVHCIYDLGESVTMDDGSEDAHLDF